MKLSFTAAAIICFALLIMIVSVFSMNTRLMILTFEEQIGLPELIQYEISYTTNIVAGCSSGDQPIARALIGLQLTPNLQAYQW